MNRLADYHWKIDSHGWTTLYKGDPADENTLIDGFTTIDPEEAVLRAIVRDHARQEAAKQPIRAGQRVHIRREWQDAGDDNFIWVAVEDEDGGRVRISPVNIGLSVTPNQVVETRMLEEGR
jgi:hypothetical protein